MEKKSQLILNPINQADALAIRHQEVIRQISSSRLALYNLLEKIYQLTEQIEMDPQKNQILDDMKNQLFSKYAIKAQRNSSISSILVRYITQSDRKTAHVYARAIETAKAEGIRPEDFSYYISEKGGVESIRKLGVKKIESNLDNKKWLDVRENRLNFMSEILKVKSENPLGSITIDKKYENIFYDQEGLSEYNYFVGKKLNGSVYKILDLLNMDYETEAILLDRLFKFKGTRAFYSEEDQEIVKKAKKALKEKLEKKNDLLEIEKNEMH